MRFLGYVPRRALKNPIVNFITASQSCFPNNSTSIPYPRFPSEAFLEAEKIMIFYLLSPGDIQFRGILVKLNHIQGSPLAELTFLIFVLELSFFYKKLIEIENYGGKHLRINSESSRLASGAHFPSVLMIL